MNFFAIFLIIMLVLFCGFELYSLIQAIRKRIAKKKEFETSSKNSKEIERKEYRN